MPPSEKLLGFFRRKFRREEASGFSILSRVPDSHVSANLAYYKSLSQTDKDAWMDCCAYWGHACYAFVAKVPRIDHTQHPFFSQWKPMRVWDFWDFKRSVPSLRSKITQYKVDTQKGVLSRITKEELDYASSIRSVKAPELRKRARAALKPLGYYRTDDLGYYCCRLENKEFRVGIDYGGRHAQLRYVVVRPEFKDQHPLLQFKYERALGVGDGDWDFIVEENVDEVFSLFTEVVKLSYELPDRLRAEVL